jgi:hypothetical protein
MAQINLDGRKIGAIRNGESCTIEIQEGNHIIFVHIASQPHFDFG